MPSRDHPESRSCVQSLARHEIFVWGFDRTQKIGVPGEHAAPAPLPLRVATAHRIPTPATALEARPPATRGAGCGRGFSPQTRIFCVSSKPATRISWLARDSTHESD